MILALVGPTGVGKTELSLRLAHTLNTDILSVDALQVYRGFDIGTAKLPLKAREGIEHHLIDHVDPREPYNVATYQKEARAHIERLRTSGKTPLFVGGSGFYLKAALYEFEFPPLQKSAPIEGDPLVRHAYLTTLDPEAAKTIHPNNRKRVEHAILKAEQGQPLSSITKGHQPIYDALIVGLTRPRETLYERIHERVDAMVEAGLEEEVRALAKVAHPTALEAIGYKEWLPYFKDQQTKEEVIDTIKRNTRRYAKKQMTYFHNQLPITWVDVSEQSLDEVHQKILTLFYEKRDKKKR